MAVVFVKKPDPQIWPIITPTRLTLIPGFDGPGLGHEGGFNRSGNATTVVFANDYGPANTSAPAPAEWGPRGFQGTGVHGWRRNVQHKYILPMTSGWDPIHAAVPMQMGTPPRAGNWTYGGAGAPHPGVHYLGAKLGTNGASRGFISDLRSSMGDITPGLSYQNRDAFGSGYAGGRTTDIVMYRSLLDRSVDELADLYYDHSDVTILDSELVDPLHISPLNPAQEAHNFGAFIGGAEGEPQPERILVFRCLMSNALSRSPETNSRGVMVANCLGFNLGGVNSHAFRLSNQEATEPVRGNAFYNWYVRGPDNGNTLIAISATSSLPAGSQLYLEGNAVWNWSAGSQSDLYRIGPQWALSATVVEAAYPVEWNEDPVYKLQAVRAELSREQLLHLTDMFERQCGPQPGWRMPQYSRAARTYSDLRTVANGGTVPSRYYNTMEEAGGLMPIPAYIIRDPRNPGPFWWAPFPTGLDRDDPVAAETAWPNLFWVPAAFRGNDREMEDPVTGVRRTGLEYWDICQRWFSSDPRTRPPITAPTFDIQIPNQTAALDAVPAFQLRPRWNFNGGALFSATGLPPGMSMYEHTGQIDGNPTAPGTYNVVITAENSEGSIESNEFTITVPEPEPSGDWADVIVDADGVQSALATNGAIVGVRGDTLSDFNPDISPGNGATLTFIAAGSFDGLEPAIELRPPTSLVGENADDAHILSTMLARGGAADIAQMNFRWLARYGATYHTLAPNAKVVGFQVGPNRGGDPLADRAAVFDNKLGGAKVFAVTANTVQQYYNPPSGYHPGDGPVANLLCELLASANHAASPPEVGNEWLCFEFVMDARQDRGNANGMAKLVMTARDGLRRELVIGLMHDAGWTFSNRYILAFEGLGFFFNTAGTAHADNWVRWSHCAFASNLASNGLIGPPPGFLT